MYTRSFSKHDEPKSITFTVDLFGCFRRMFSGFKSQWMTFCFRRNFSDVRSCDANLRTSPNDSPWKLLFLMNSYRLIDKSSNEMHRCSRK